MGKNGQLLVIAELLINHCNGWLIIRENKVYFMPNQDELDWTSENMRFHQVVKKLSTNYGLEYKWSEYLPCPMCDEYELQGFDVGRKGVLVIS